MLMLGFFLSYCFLGYIICNIIATYLISQRVLIFKCDTHSVNSKIINRRLVISNN